MTKERYIDDDLRAIADGRLHLNVRHGIALPVSMIIRAADEIQALRVQLAEAQKGLNFAADILEEWWDRSYDGGDLQEAGKRCGLLVEQEIAAPCGSGCVCEEYGATFPTKCYRYSAPLFAAIRALKGPQP